MVATLVKSIALDIVGLAFAGVAVWGFVTGHSDAARDALPVAGFYLGVKAS